MKQSINFSQFTAAFHAHDRYDSFGYDGLRLIFDYLESYEGDTGEEIELDVIAICCDYNMLSFEDVAREYDIDVEGLDNAEAKQHVMNYLCDNTYVIGEANGCFVYQVF